MFKLNRGAEIGEHGSTEQEFEKIINFFKNSVECVEVSRTGQAEDNSLTVELKYRDFPTFSIKMDSSTYNKGRITKIGGIVPSLMVISSRETALDVVLTENLFWCRGNLTSPFGMLKNNLSEHFWLSGESVFSCQAGNSNSSRVLTVFPKCFSLNGKVVVLDVFCPSVSMTSPSDEIDFEKKFLNLKNISGIGNFNSLSRFSVDGQEYIRMTNSICIEVTP